MRRVGHPPIEEPPDAAPGQTHHPFGCDALQLELGQVDLEEVREPPCPRPSVRRADPDTAWLINGPASASGTALRSASSARRTTVIRRSSAAVGSPPPTPGRTGLAAVGFDDERVAGVRVSDGVGGDEAGRPEGDPVEPPGRGGRDGDVAAADGGDEARDEARDDAEDGAAAVGLDDRVAEPDAAPDVDAPAADEVEPGDDAGGPTARRCAAGPSGPAGRPGASSPDRYRPARLGRSGLARPALGSRGRDRSGFAAGRARAAGAGPSGVTSRRTDSFDRRKSS